MSKSLAEQEPGPDEAPMLGDHLALDLLNTEARSDGVVLEYWHSGEDVLRWLARQGIVPASSSEQPEHGKLLAQAIALRKLARRLIDQRKEGTALGDIDGLNVFLNAHLSAPQLAHDGAGKLVLHRIARGDAIGALLGPVAEAVAALLVDGDFALVRQCEHPECILWFYDRTKAHKRRWCSMAVCGNRYKAAQFRMKNSRATV
jgi:predicted RNA-binding Zn ribbon-like protein